MSRGLHVRLVGRCRVLHDTMKRLERPIHGYMRGKHDGDHARIKSLIKRTVKYVSPIDGKIIVGPEHGLRV